MPGGDPVDFQTDSLIMKFVIYQQALINSTVNQNITLYNLN